MFRRKQSTGRHAAQAPAAPQPGPAPAGPVPPAGLGAGARLTAGGPPGAGPEFTGLRPAPGGQHAAVISLGGRFEVEVTRALWLDDLITAARDARAALTRGAREARKAQIADATGPRFTPAPAAGPPAPEGGQM